MEYLSLVTNAFWNYLLLQSKQTIICKPQDHNLSPPLSERWNEYISFLFLHPGKYEPWGAVTIGVNKPLGTEVDKRHVLELEYLESSTHSSLHVDDKQMSGWALKEMATLSFSSVTLAFMGPNMGQWPFRTHKHNKFVHETDTLVQSACQVTVPQATSHLKWWLWNQAASLLGLTITGWGELEATPRVWLFQDVTSPPRGFFRCFYDHSPGDDKQRRPAFDTHWFNRFSHVWGLDWESTHLLCNSETFVRQTRHFSCHWNHFVPVGFLKIILFYSLRNCTKPP